MKVMCLFEGFDYDDTPHYGDICEVTKIYYNHDMPDGISGYALEEHPQPQPYRFGKWRRAAKGLEPNFIEIEEDENEESELLQETTEIHYTDLIGLILA